ncbi:hypothetical protein CJO79_03515 [Ralstonia solanacearum]|uniref:hypothetical protein n=1 Tax=Ralstonia solanacearum TaxID=305 RepID=UPI000E597F58|nr:hypothetical protein CJO79_03515 [Ralstonia solanacearum]AXW18317.1 hypothetical protein CJO85_03555 [Ralstonia solanacearum]AXW75032.1 hypothetical protein CJO97_03525 [Ralstonia solanacearum]
MLGAGQVIINNFDLNRAETDANGYLGIKFKEKIASAAGTNRNPQSHRDALGNLITDPHSPTQVGDGNNTIAVAAGTNDIRVGNGTDTVQTGNGVNTIHLGAGQVTLTSYGGQDTVTFASTVQDDQLWFAQDGNDLLVTVDGTSSNLRPTDWFNGATHATLVAGDGHPLIDSQVASLVQAMAQFSPPSAGQTTLLQPQQDSLAPVIAASWR